MVNAAIVKIWGELVGAIAWDQDQELGVFEYDEEFMAKGWDISPLKMPINTGQTIFSFPGLRPQRNSEFNTFRGLPGLLADVLPDKYGNELIEIWLAQQGRAENSMNPVEMLCFIGKRGMGALEFEPMHLTNSKKTFSVEIESLVEIAQKMISEREGFNANFQESDKRAIVELITIGTSAGGARPKAVIAYNEKTGEVRSGQTNAPRGFEHWLIKLDGVSDVQVGETKMYGRIEMAYYQMAKACGIEMMESRLLEENGRAHFMTKRFDRTGSSTKHHIQTWCAMKHFDFNDVTSFSYEQLFQTMRELKLPYTSAIQLYRRMVFNVIARNCDDHTKNFSFLLKKDRNWELAPAYDVCHAYRPDSPWVSQHALSINGKRKGILKHDLITLAEAMNIKKAEAIIDEINHVINAWEDFANQQKVSKNKIKEIGLTLLNITP